jgi:putative nucleotidyltransferase with HDIG domain
VGADPVLARVGAYYHDIGKLTRPYFFIENQFQGNNPHDKIPPSLSSMILTAHVRGGVELANQYKLPQVIKDIIQQHHGNTLIGFFYHRAVAERGSKDHLLEDKFRYDGPKPQFKEAGIIMLADSVEAAVRSLSQPNQFRIQNMVAKIVRDKLSDGQLDECDLTLKDLSLISDAFVRVLTGIYHKRIAYPTEQDLAKLGS